MYPITKGVSKQLLGDGSDYGSYFTSMLKEAVCAAEQDKKTTVFGYWVSDPERYGVAEPTPNREQYQACA